MPTKCTRPSRSAGSSSSGTGTLIGAASRPASSTIRASFSSASRGISAGGGRATSRPAGRGRWPAPGTVRGHPLRGERARRRPAAPPPASTTGRALSSCSPLPIGSGTKTAGRPTAATSVTVLAPAAADARGRRRRRRGPSGRRTAARRTAARRPRGSPAPRPSGRRRAAPGRRRRRAPRPAPDTAWLSRRAPCEPPVTSSVGRSGSSPKNAPRLGAQRGPVERARSSGGSAARRTPRAAAGCPGSWSRRGAVNRAPSLLARPGSALPSCTTIGSVPAAGGEVGRHRDVAAEADHHVGPHPVERPPAPP